MKKGTMVASRFCFYGADLVLLYDTHALSAYSRFSGIIAALSDGKYRTAFYPRIFSLNFRLQGEVDDIYRPEPP